MTPPEALPKILATARAAQAEWVRLSFAERGRVLLRFVDVLYENADEFATAIHRYNGKLVFEAMVSEIFPTLANFKYFATAAERYLSPESVPLATFPLSKSYILYEPLGVVGIISAWNYPFYIALWDVPAALMAGNAVIIKPSEHSAAIGLLIEDLLRRAGFPSGLVQVVYGFGDLGAALIGCGIKKVCFIGSAKTGRKVYAAAAAAMIPCTLELGGKDAALILEDADLTKTAKGILWASFTNAGQTCASVELIYVPRRLCENFTTIFRREFEALPRANIGTMNAAFQRQIVEEQTHEALERGARRIAHRDLRDGKNPFAVEMSIFTDVPQDATLVTEAIFGPSVVVIPYDSLDAAIAEINAKPYGLTDSVWTEHYAAGEAVARRLDAGVVTVNDHMLSVGLPEAPWSGHKESGIGVSRSHLALRDFCKVKYVYHDRGLVRNKFWQYPFTEEKEKILRLVLTAQFSPCFFKRGLAWLAMLPKLLRRGRN